MVIIILFEMRVQEKGWNSSDHTFILHFDDKYLKKKSNLLFPSIIMISTYAVKVFGMIDFQSLDSDSLTN